MRALIRFRSVPRWPLAVVVALLIGCQAHAATLRYKLYVLGLAVADAGISINLDPGGYRMGLNYKTAGIGSMMSGDYLDERVSGLLGRQGPEPYEFRSAIRLHGQDRLLSMIFRGGAPTLATVVPPNESEREIVPPAQLRDTIDPLTATLTMLRRAGDTGRCETAVRTFDGRRLEAFQSITGPEEDVPTSIHTGYAGRGLRCDYTSHVLAGFRNGSGRDEDGRDRAGTFWLAPLVPGLPRLPMRGELDTRFLGRATMYLQTIEP